MNPPQPSSSETCRSVGRAANQGAGSGWLVATAALATLFTVLSASHARAQSCPPPIQPITDLTLDRFYKDAAGSRTDASVLARNREKTASLKRLLQNTADLADRLVTRSVPPAAGSCDRKRLENLLAWARSGALTGPMSTRQGEHHRKWAFTGLSLAYLKMRPALSTSESQRLERWLKQLAADSAALFDQPGIKRNNHYYWLGTGTAALALATGTSALWQRAEGIYDTAIGHIDADGALPMEMARGKRALHYHGFALTALVPLHRMMAIHDPARARSSAPALQRLIDLTSNASRSPGPFERLSGHRQEVHPDPDRRTGYGWSQLLADTGDIRRARATPATPRAYRWLGGDVSNLAARLEDLAAYPSPPSTPATSANPEPVRPPATPDQPQSARQQSPSRPLSEPNQPSPSPLSVDFWREHFAPPSPAVVPPARLVQLGERLFSDTRLSGPADMSCATCHRPERVFTDGIARRTDRNGKPLNNVPSILGAGFARRLHWDGAFTDLKSQAEHAITAENEMAGDWPVILERLNADTALRTRYATAFGAPAKAPIDQSGVLEALAAFTVSKVPPFMTPFDRFIAGDDAALGPAAHAGFELFVGKAGCVLCHGTWRLTNDAMHPSRPIRPARTTPPYVKTPGLRLISRTSPYMHDGGHPTLTAVVETYATAPRAQSPPGAILQPGEIRPLTPDEKAALVAFLNSL